MLVDSHCHLDFPDFLDDLDAVVARAQDAGIGHMLTIGTHLSKFDGVLAVAERFPQIYCSVGVHPHEAATETGVSFDRLLGLTRHDKVIGIGETGLDYFYEHSPKAEQIESFRLHIDVARETGLPLIVHTRDADDDTAAILRETVAEGPFPGLIHCFSSSLELAEVALDLGFYISISGIVTFKGAQDLRDIVKTIPIERLLVETDSPYLAPVPKRGKRNEPSYTAHTAAVVADLKGLSYDEVAKQTTDNFFQLFTKAKQTTDKNPGSACA